MSPSSITVQAVFENGVLRPLQPLPLSVHQQVTVVVQLPDMATRWPEDVAEIYQEINTEDRRLAEAMWSTVAETWPALEEPQP